MGQYSGKVYLFVTKRTDVEPRLADGLADAVAGIRRDGEGSKGRIRRLSSTTATRDGAGR